VKGGCREAGRQCAALTNKIRWSEKKEKDQIGSFERDKRQGGGIDEEEPKRDSPSFGFCMNQGECRIFGCVDTGLSQLDRDL